MYSRVDWEGIFKTTITDPEPLGKLRTYLNGAEIDAGAGNWFFGSSVLEDARFPPWATARDVISRTRSARSGR